MFAVQTSLDPKKAIPLLDYFKAAAHSWEFYALCAIALLFAWVLRRRKE